MSDADSDDVPLAQREVVDRRLSSIVSSIKVDDDATFGGVVDDDGDDDLPDWMKKHKTPEKIEKPAVSSSSESDIPIGKLKDDKDTAGSGKAAAGGKKHSAAAAGGVAGGAGPSSQSTFVIAGSQATTIAGAQESGRAAAGSSKVKLSEMPLVMPEKVATNKAVVECEGAEGGQTDLTGDVGAVGRWTVGEGGGIVLDLKGVMYSAAIAPSNTLMVINVGEKEAKVESLFSDYIQLREQANMYQTENTLAGNMADYFIGADSDDDMDGKKKEKKEKKEKAEAAKRKREGDAGGQGGGGKGAAAKKPKAAAKKKPAAKKPAAKKKPAKGK